MVTMDIYGHLFPSDQEALAALTGFPGRPYIDLMAFGVWGSIENARRG
jgi:hypothetical protein